MIAAAPAPRALVELIVEMFLDGHPTARADADFHRTRIAWEWESGQWTMSTTPRHRFLGWLSYYRLTDAKLDQLRELDVDTLMRVGQGAALDLTRGPHLYFATALVAPWAPKDTFLDMCRMLMREHRDAKSVSWHHINADGSTRFVCRPPDHDYV